MVMVVWRGLAADSVEHLDLTARDDKLRARSTVDLGPEKLEYAVELDPTWTFVALSLRSSDGRTLELARDDGEWHANGSACPDLAEAEDIDLAFSPFTNTLPIRRLGLAVGESADIVTAYVDHESFTVTTTRSGTPNSPPTDTCTSPATATSGARSPWTTTGS